MVQVVPSPKDHLVLTASLRATFGTLCYVVLLAYVHAASALVAVLRDSATRNQLDEDVVLLWCVTLVLVGLRLTLLVLS